MIKIPKERRERLEKTVVYINGEYCSGLDAKISIFDGFFQLGAAVFDAVSLWNGFLIKLDSHVKRFYEGMHAFDLEIPLSKEEFKEVIFETVRRSKLKDGLIYETATLGFPPGGARGFGPPDLESRTLIVYCEPYVWVGGEEGQKAGIKTRITKIKDYPIQCVEGRAKSWNRANYYLALMELRGTDAVFPIMTDMDGYIGQTIGTNLGIFKDGKLITPGGNILYGITREAVIDIARLEDIEVIISNLTPYELYNADEVFLCTSAGGIIPVIDIDTRRIGDGKPGPMTKHLTEAYWKMHVNPKYATKVPDLD